MSTHQPWGRRWALALLPAAVGAAFAQGAPQAAPGEEDAPTLETVQVRSMRNAARYGYAAPESATATKTATPIIETPQSVSVVTGRHLDEREPQDIAETLAYTSGVQGGCRGENGVIEMAVRGIGVKSEGGGQGTYWNGLPYRPSLEFSPYALERVEVLKGPASVLYGQANPGGIVNLVTKRPTRQNVNEVVFKTGSGQRAELGLDLDRKAGDALSWRLAANGRRQYLQAGKPAQIKGLMLLPPLVWQPNNDTRLLLEAFYENLPKAGDRNFLLRRGTVDAVEGQTVSTRFFAGDPHFFDLHSRKRQAGGEFSHRFSPLLTFQQFLRYGRYDDYLKSLIVWDPGAGSEIIRKARIFDQHNRETQSDTRLQWRFATGAAQHTLLTGLDWRRGKEKLGTWLGSAPSIDWRRPVYGVAVDAPPYQFGRDTAMRQTGLYAQDQIALGPWRFIAGLRRDHASSRSDGDARQKDSKLTWRAGALYQAASGLHPYLSYSTSFLPEAGKDAAGGFLKPTTAAQVEAGVKYQPPGSQMLLTAAWFSITQKNLTVTDPATRLRSQRGKVRTRGLELELQGDLSPQWGLSGSYTWLDKKVREDSNPRLIGTTQWGVPAHSASFWVDHRFAGALRGFSAGLGVRRQGKTWGDNANTFRIPAFTLLDAKLDWDPGQHFPTLRGSFVQLNVQNLAGRRYVASCANDYSCFLGKERRATLSAGYRW